MILVFIHGAPATGKYTVACQLAATTGLELYHNHLVVDDVLSRHAFGTPAFIAERDQAWRTFFTAAAANAGRRLIFTFNPENSVPQAFIDWIFHDLPGVTLHSVRLQLAEALIEARLATEHRNKFRKLTDVALYRQLRDSGTFNTPLIPHTDLELDTGQLTPPEAASRIIRCFHLD